jgi:hypothetical protein
MVGFIFFIMSLIAKALCVVAMIESIIICAVVVYAFLKNGVLGVLCGIFFIPPVIIIFCIALFPMLEFVVS